MTVTVTVTVTLTVTVTVAVTNLHHRVAALSRLRGLIAKGLCREEDVPALYKELEERAAQALRGAPRNRGLTRGKLQSHTGAKRSPPEKQSNRAGDGGKTDGGKADGGKTDGGKADGGKAVGEQMASRGRGGRGQGGSLRRASQRGMPPRGGRGTRRPL